MPTQVYVKGQNVLDAARARIAFVFDAFATVHVSVSGGKDSTVLAHLALEEARRRDRKVGLFFLDEEVVYQSTVDQVEYLMGLYPRHTNRLWLQVPFHLTNATSMGESQLIAWEPGQHKRWMRPKGRGNITAKPWPADAERWASGYKWLDFYGVLESFERCYSDTAWLVGLRGVESPNRWRTMVKHPVDIQGERIYWATRNPPNCNLYPIYDWNYSDIWRYIHETGLQYSKVYDWLFRKGAGMNEMRVSSLIHEKSFKSLCDLPEFEPRTYDRLLARIKGVAFAQEHGKTAKALACRKLPKGHKTWRGYRDFLLSTYPQAEHRALFARRFARQLDNEYVARQQCRQLILADTENNLAVDNKPDPREETVRYYMEHL